MKPLALFFSCFWLAGCGGCGGGSAKPPGDEAIGSFMLAGEGASKTCAIPNIPANIEVDVVLSHFSDGGAVFFTLIGANGNVVYDAGFDGQFVNSANSGGGHYSWDGGSCDGCRTLVTTASYNLALLSRSQSAAVGEMCPPNPLDGGVPPEDPDAGITLPRATADAGFDVRRACGELRLSIIGTGFGCDPACISCQLLYTLKGQRQ